MPNEALDQFGQMLMENARDMAIKELDANLKASGHALSTKLVQAILKTKELDTDEKLQKIIPIAVDTTLHYLLWMFENEMKLKISLETSSDVIPDISGISDGLSGEIFGSKGWIVRFSKERFDEALITPTLSVKRR